MQGEAWASSNTTPALHVEWLLLSRSVQSIWSWTPSCDWLPQSFGTLIVLLFLSTRCCLGIWVNKGPYYNHWSLGRPSTHQVLWTSATVFEERGRLLAVDMELRPNYVTTRANVLHGSYGICRTQCPLVQNSKIKVLLQDFPGSAVDKNPSANAGDRGSIPGSGRFHMPQSN